jgi:hypothetical protein
MQYIIHDFLQSTAILKENVFMNTFLQMRLDNQWIQNFLSDPDLDPDPGLNKYNFTKNLFRSASGCF